MHRRIDAGKRQRSCLVRTGINTEAVHTRKTQDIQANMHVQTQAAAEEAARREREVLEAAKDTEEKVRESRGRACVVRVRR